MNNILTLLDELIRICEEEDKKNLREARSLVKISSQESFMVHHLKLLKQEIINYDNSRTNK